MYTLIFVGLIPLILFAICEYYFTTQKGVIAAIGSSLLIAVFTWFYFGELDLDTGLMIAFVFLMGLLTIRSENPLFFKMQPTLSSFTSALILAWYQYFDTPLMIKMLPKMQALLTYEQKNLLNDPTVLPYLARLTEFSIIWIIVHGLLMAWLAYYSTTKKWLWAKILFLPYCLFAVGLSEVLYRALAFP